MSATQPERVSDHRRFEYHPLETDTTIRLIKVFPKRKVGFVGVNMFHVDFPESTDDNSESHNTNVCRTPEVTPRRNTRSLLTAVFSACARIFSNFSSLQQSLICAKRALYGSMRCVSMQEVGTVIGNISTDDILRDALVQQYNFRRRQETSQGFDEKIKLPADYVLELLRIINV